MDREQGRLSHPLDRPVWSALSTRQAHIAHRVGPAVRLQPDYGMFAAVADADATPLRHLPCTADGLWCVEVEPVQPPSGMIVHRRAQCVQMVADRIDLAEPRLEVEQLSESDAAEMLALAHLTVPGPFFENTHRMGRFIGVKQAGHLVAMAGERLRPSGYTEVSGVCTHPDYRGRGYAAGLMRIVAARILAEGDLPFLHSYADNEAAVMLYEKLGFRIRSSITLTVLMHG